MSYIYPQRRFWYPSNGGAEDETGIPENDPFEIIQVAESWFSSHGFSPDAGTPGQGFLLGGFCESRQKVSP